MENEKQALEAIRKEIYAPAPYIVNDRQLAQVVETYLTSTTQDKLFIFGHTGIGKSEIVQRVAEQKNIHITKYSFEDAKAGLITLNAKAENIIEIECLNIQDLYQSPESVLSLNLPCKVIVEVTVNFEGDVRNFVIKNHDVFKWVYYRETPEDVLSYMKANGCDSLIIEYLTQNPEQISGFQNKECKMYQEGVESLLQELERVGSNHDINVQNIMQGMHQVIWSTISDEPVRSITQRVMATLWQNKENIGDPFVCVQLTMVFDRDMPYVESYYREI